MILQCGQRWNKKCYIQNKIFNQMFIKVLIKWGLFLNDFTYRKHVYCVAFTQFQTKICILNTNIILKFYILYLYLHADYIYTWDFSENSEIFLHTKWLWHVFISATAGQTFEKLNLLHPHTHTYNHMKDSTWALKQFHTPKHLAKFFGLLCERMCVH